MEYKLFNRELSWLSFNYRVLQEAKDTSVPLYERIKFLAIYSSNLDEFFRVRVASLRSLLDLKKKAKKQLEFDLEKLLDRIHRTVDAQQVEFGKIYREQIIPELKSNNIFIVNENELNEEQLNYSKEYFHSQIIPHLTPMIIFKKRITPFLRNQRLYLAVKLTSKKGKKTTDGDKKKKRFFYAIVEIPSNHLPRFIELPRAEGRTCIIFLDDMIRIFLPQIFYGYNIVSAYSVKLSRDAELYIDDEFSGNLLEKIKKSISKRSSGVPCRFLYDNDMPGDFLKFLKESLFLSKQDLFPGGKYHNFDNFFSFPNPGLKELQYRSLSPLKNKEFDKYSDMFSALSQKDFLLYYPYHSYDHVLQMLNAAARDPGVTSIKITQYRVAKESAVINSLINAARRGKTVTAFVEVKARFDEEVNIRSAEEMQKAGVKVLYSLPGIKVHSKMALISRSENGKVKDYAYLGTGNFNEKTARLYTDFGFFTSDRRYTEEVNRVFDFLEGKYHGKEEKLNFKHLLVAQFNMRRDFRSMIDREITNAKEGKKASITAKMNSLEDERIINKLYDASKAGVKVSLIIRGICCLIPGVKGMSENIRVISIVDRFLEHGRVFIFQNGGREKIYLSSADWMKRNLSRRIEVAFPVYDRGLKNTIKDILNIQLEDNTKARQVDEKQSNDYIESIPEKSVRSQYKIYDYLKQTG